MIAERPTVTVVVSAHNARPFIAETIASALHQTWNALDLVVVDDGSTDGTGDVLDAIADPRLRVIRRRNGGAASALNTAIEASKGPYIAVLDHDDLWDPEKLRRHMEFFERHDDVDLTFSWWRLIDQKGRRLALHSRRQAGSVGFAELLNDYVIGPTSSVVMRRGVLDRTGLFDPEFRRYYDMDLFLRIALTRQRNVHAIPEELTFYRRHSGQLSADWRAMRDEWPALLAKARGLAPELVDSVAHLANANMQRYFAYLAYENREYGSALRLLRQTFNGSAGHFVTDWRNLRLGVACVAGVVLPRAAFQRLEEFAGVR